MNRCNLLIRSFSIILLVSCLACDNHSKLPIGVFDSGTGGLAVLNSIIELDEFNNKSHAPGSDGIPDFNSEHFIYLADEANMPYGKYDSEGKADFLRELVLKDVQFLIGDRFYASVDDDRPKGYKDPVKSIVIACNTATAFGLDTARKAMDSWNPELNIYGIIEAGAKAAIDYIPDENGANSIIGILATEGTCSSGAYPRSVFKYAGEMLSNRVVQTIQQAGIGLAGAVDGDLNYLDPDADIFRNEDEYFGPGLNHPVYKIDTSIWDQYNFELGNKLLFEKDEEGKTVEVQLNSVNNYIRYMVTSITNKLTGLKQDGSLNAVILGCTHYPYVDDEILSHFMYLRNYNIVYRNLIAENIQLIDPAKSLAIDLYRGLYADELLNDKGKLSGEFYISVPNPHLKLNQIDENGEFPYDWKYGREINTGLLFVKRVPFSHEWIDQEVILRIKEDLPSTYALIDFSNK